MRSMSFMCQDDRARGDKKTVLVFIVYSPEAIQPALLIQFHVMTCPA